MKQYLYEYRAILENEEFFPFFVLALDVAEAEIKALALMAEYKHARCSVTQIRYPIAEGVYS